MDLMVDAGAMAGVARQLRQASGALDSERTLSGAGAASFGAAVVETAYVPCARMLDAMTESLRDDTATLGGFVTDAAEAMIVADTDLAGAAR